MDVKTCAAFDASPAARLLLISPAKQILKQWQRVSTDKKKMDEPPRMSTMSARAFFASTAFHCLRGLL